MPAPNARGELAGRRLFGIDIGTLYVSDSAMILWGSKEAADVLAIPSSRNARLMCPTAAAITRQAVRSKSCLLHLGPREAQTMMQDLASRVLFSPSLLQQGILATRPWLALSHAVFASVQMHGT